LEQEARDMLVVAIGEQSAPPQFKIITEFYAAQPEPNSQSVGKYIELLATSGAVDFLETVPLLLGGNAAAPQRVESQPSVSEAPPPPPPPAAPVSPPAKADEPPADPYYGVKILPSVHEKANEIVREAKEAAARGGAFAHNPYQGSRGFNIWQKKLFTAGLAAETAKLSGSPALAAAAPLPTAEPERFGERQEPVADAPLEQVERAESDDGPVFEEGDPGPDVTQFAGVPSEAIDQASGEPLEEEIQDEDLTLPLPLARPAVPSPPPRQPVNFSPPPAIASPAKPKTTGFVKPERPAPGPAAASGSRPHFLKEHHPPTTPAGGAKS
jgi:hypothetical protein